MKPYSQPELRTFVNERLLPLVGSRLQEVLVNDRGLALGLWREGMSWLILDLAPNAPLALLFENECPFRKGKTSKPVSLFLKSHGANKKLDEVELDETLGRVLRLKLRGADSSCEIEVQLIPRQPNVIVSSQGKQVAWEKPKTLSEPPLTTEFPPSRPLELIHREWKSPPVVESAKGDPEQEWRKKKERDLLKKRSALSELNKQIRSDEAELWFQRGEALKSGEGELIDPSRPRSWNLEEAFRRGKKLLAKKQGVKDRVAALLEEIARLEGETYEDFARRGSAKAPALMARSRAKGRTLPVGEGVTAYLGKSAADNLALLRKAKAWDLWIHLRDEPGAHAIVQRPKAGVVGDESLRRIARWLLKESVKKLPLPGEKVPFVVAECRHVRPIKGDRLGRVTYHEARHLELRWED